MKSKHITKEKRKPQKKKDPKETSTYTTEEREESDQSDFILDWNKIELKIYSTEFNYLLKCDNLKENLPNRLKTKSTDRSILLK